MTSSLRDSIEAAEVAAGSVKAWWLSGSGFIFKTPAGTQIWIDPYLSNSVQATFGMGRAVPVPLDPRQARPDAVISTHWHEDHMDPGTIPVIAAASPATRFLAPPGARSRAIGWGVPPDRITPLAAGEQVDVADVTVEAVPARHDPGILGWDAPDAIGVLLHVAGLTIYHCGDTEYDVRLRQLRARRPDVAIACINGVTGNMDAHEAALLCYQLKATTVIPMHHLLWDRNSNEEATLDPNVFATTYRNLGGTGRVVLPEVGAEIELKRA